MGGVERDGRSSVAVPFLLFLLSLWPFGPWFCGPPTLVQRRRQRLNRALNRARAIASVSVSISIRVQFSFDAFRLSAPHQQQLRHENENNRNRSSQKEYYRSVSEKRRIRSLIKESWSNPAQLLVQFGFTLGCEQ